MINIPNPWKNSWTIRLVAAIDMAFACLLVSIYMQKFLAPVTHENVFSEFQRTPSLKLFLLGPIIFNSFQVVMSFNLFTAARRGNEFVISYAKASTWFQFSTVMLVFLMLKLFLVLWFPPHGSIGRKDIFGATLIILESIFKIFGLFIVKEFIDDLKSIVSLFPTPQFYCVYAAPPAPSTFPVTTTENVTSPTTTREEVHSNGNVGSTSPPQMSPPAAPLSPPLPLTQPNRHSVIIATV